MKNKYDVFIGYHGTYSPTGSKIKADDVYNYLTKKGLKCYYFPKNKETNYKYTIHEIASCTCFLLVVTKGLHTTEEGKINPAWNFELASEVNSMYALTLQGKREIEDSHVLAVGDEWYKGSECSLNDLFQNRIHFYMNSKENPLEDIYNWIIDRKKHYKVHYSKYGAEVEKVFKNFEYASMYYELDNMILDANIVCCSKDKKLLNKLNKNSLQYIKDNNLLKIVNTKFPSLRIDNLMFSELIEDETVLVSGLVENESLLTKLL